MPYVVSSMDEKGTGKHGNSEAAQKNVEMRIFEDRVGIPSGMIRVVSCHHFDSQDVFLSDPEPVALCTAQEKLLVATVQHSVEVRDLDCRGHILHSFPTVDRVKQMIYCDAGNYVATLERKSSRHSCPITYVRVYLNWWIDMKGQPMRVRIAGCVTPSSQSSGGQLEMVELPLDEMATCICCCKRTATLAICKGKNISVYSYNLKVHDISKQRFHDFDLLMNLTLSFPVQEMMLCEDYFACISPSEVQVFRVLFDVSQDLSSLTEDSKPYTQKDAMYRYQDDVVDEHSPDTCIEISFDSYFEKNDGVDGRYQLDCLHLFPTEIKLPSIQKSNMLANVKPQNLEICGPSIDIPGCHIEIKMNSKYETWENISLAKVQVINMLYRSFPGNGEHGLQSLHLCPLYVTEELKDHLVDPLSAAAAVSDSYFSNSPLHSASYDKLKGLGCFFSGSQMGYLYDVKAETKLLCQYPYTAVMKSVAVEPELIHVLTETGLETYTSRLCHRVISQIETVDHISNTCPSGDEAVCLLGLRPFLGVEQLCLSDGYLILISTTDDSISSTESIDSGSCTIYSLKKPNPQQLHCDLMEMAQYHQNSSPATYIHLLSEAHIILRSYMILKGYNPSIKDLYKTCCALMADHFLSCEIILDRPLAIPYYNMSELSIDDVVLRVTTLHSKMKQSSHIMRVLVSYLDHRLLRSNQSYCITKETGEAILDIYAEETPDSLWEIVLHLGISSYKLDKAILLLKKRITSKKSTAADTLAIAVLLLKKGNKDAAQNMLLSLSKEELVTVLLDLQKLLYNGSNLTVVGQLIKQTRPDAFVEVLLSFVQNKLSTVENVISILKEESVEEETYTVPLLKEFLESFISKRKYDTQPCNEAVTLLLTIYIQRLKADPKFSSQRSTVSFGLVKSVSLFGNRQAWLNNVPPFNGHGITRTCSRTEAGSDAGLKDMTCLCWNCNEDLLRIQSLLCSDLINEEILFFVQNLLENTSCLHQNVLKILCSKQEVAVQHLVEKYPAAILPYAFDNFKDEDEWCQLLSLLEKKIGDNNCDNDKSKSYVLYQNFQGVLSHLSEVLHPEKFMKLSENSEACYIPFVKRCLEKHQAIQLKDKIMSLGMEIKAML